ncbi:aminotransferase class V-fold PLP-dependent enzyme [Algivirga pacifica]|uniref:phosphoserine transaminase n=1 Tax=Algivirga pacifica TaxID=1162670 RepID=A0ABP9CY18_9BACT
MKNKRYYLTPGPSELYFTAAEHMQYALRNDLGSISHRSKQFQEIFQFTTAQLRQLLNIPSSYHIVFTGSATEVWQLLLANCTEQSTYHFVNGSFSSRFYEFAKELNRNAQKLEVPFGEGFDISEANIPAETEMICVTQNETSAGTCMPVEDINTLRKEHPEALLVVDAVSAVPYAPIDFEQIDSLFFSVQKGMGLPAGLGVWIFNDRCVARFKALKEKGQVVPPYHAMDTMLKNAEKHMTQATPNVIGIYTLGKVAEDMNRRTVEVIRQETVFKAATIYGLLERHTKFKPFVREEKHRSQTVIVADIIDEDYTAATVIEKLEAHGIVVGKGYGEFKDKQIRIANFPTHSKEIFYQLADVLETL